MRNLLLVAGLLVACCAFSVIGSSDRPEPYRGYKIVSAWPTTHDQVKAIQAIDQWRETDVFTHRLAPGKKVDFMIPGSSFPAVEKVLRIKGVRFQVTNNDVQEAVNAEAKQQEQSRRLYGARSAAPQSGPNFERYMRYDEIVRYLKEVQKQHSDIATLESVGKSSEGRDLWVLRLSKAGNKAAKAIYVDAGIHAREWIAPPVAIYLIQQLTENSKDNADLLDGLDWYIMPLVNPDGYEYTHTRERFWRKNRNPAASRWCKGTDVNRNFGFHWGEQGVSTNPCSEIYAGPSAFSEPESRAVRDYILKENKSKRIKMYLTLHSYGPLILYPWGYDYNLNAADDVSELIDIGNRANEAMVAAGSVRFTVENSAELYPASGASDDWSKGVAEIAKAYTIELPGGGSQGFDMPASQILPVTKQVFAGLRSFALDAKKLD